MTGQTLESDDEDDPRRRKKSRSGPRAFLVKVTFEKLRGVVTRFWTCPRCGGFPERRGVSSVSSPAEPSESALAKSRTVHRRSLPTTKQEMYEALFRLKPDNPPNSKVLKIGMLGLPGVGKSSLVNRLSMFQACATSQKINTTRSKQSVVFTQDKTQLVFMDLPGVMSGSKARRHNLARSIIRDPHAGIHQSDIICVVVDASNAHMRRSLDKQILKALHFFDDKPTVLVLTKTDKLVKRRFRLLDATRCLSDGIVAGRVIYQNKYNLRYSSSPPTVEIPMLSGAQQVDELNTATVRALDGKTDEEIVEELKSDWELNLEERGLEEMVEEEEEELTEEDEEEEEEAEVSPTPDGAQATDGSPKALKSRIDEYFDSVVPSAEVLDEDARPARRDIDPVLALLRQQMMLESVTREEVARRVRKWHLLDDKIRGKTAWPNFQEVFMVSSANGRGVALLRDYLLSQAKRGPWVYHSSLVSDQDPYDTVCYAVQAQCLNLLNREIPYALTVEVTDYDKDDNGTIFVELDVKCRTERQMKKVLGMGGETVRKIVSEASEDLKNAFQTDVKLKVAVKLATIPKKHLKFIKKSKDFRKAFPQLSL